MGRNVVYIIGFMGSGKSTTGRNIASMLGWTFVDLDRKIEESQGITISEIFSGYGEEHFRLLESEMLRSLGSVKDVVISTGGGTPCHNDNMSYMLQTGLTIYLKLNPEQLQRRLSGSGDRRPLLKDQHGPKLLPFIKEKLSSREKWYNMAEIVYEGVNVNMNDLYAILKLQLEI
jgi:shikimate kinase